MPRSTTHSSALSPVGIHRLVALVLLAILSAGCGGHPPLSPPWERPEREGAGTFDPKLDPRDILPIDPVLRDVLLERDPFDALRKRPPGIAVVSSAAGRLDVFARAEDGALLYKLVTARGENSWVSLGGDITSDPAAFSDRPGHFDVFARGREGELAHLGFHGGAWQDWASLGGRIESAPAVTSPAAGRLEVFARGTENRLVRRTFSAGHWLPWEDLGQAVLSDPAAASRRGHGLDVFARGADGDLAHRSFAGGWSTWESLGGKLTSAPAVVATGPDHLHVFARGLGGVLLHRTLRAGTWGEWEDLGGRIESAPDAVGFPDGRIEVFARGLNDRLIQRTFSGSAWGEARLRERIELEPAWGVADLHAHPASHLSFGAGEAGGGILWGNPGLAFDSTGLSVTGDLPPCPQDKHAHFDEDHVRDATRKNVISTIDGLTGHAHASGADGRYATWPHALSLSHQQMHVSFVRRAYQGGVRLMFASVTDNQTLSMLWHRHYQPADARLPIVSPTADYDSARRQLRFIRRLAAANPGWMQVVTTPREAREAIRANKLALVLALEMDTLTVAQILALQSELGVASVAPVHLADNPIGGSAIYSDTFNTNNWYLNRRFHSVRGNPLLRFRLSQPQYLHMHRFDVFKGGAAEPLPWDRGDYCRNLRYEPCPELGTTGIAWTEGHENVRGIDEPLFQRLLAAGLMVDVSHMGRRATEGALALAERFGYPLIASHGGVRGDRELGGSERSLLYSHAERIADLGGVLGIGTEGQAAGTVVAQDRGHPLVRFSGDRRSWTRSLRATGSLGAASGLRVTLRTGGDDLRGGSDNAFAIVRYRAASGILRTVRAPLNGSANWAGNSTHTVWIPLPERPQVALIETFGIETTLSGGLFGDNWNLDEVLVEYEAGGEFLDLLRRQGTPFIRFSGSNRSWMEALRRDHPMEAALASLTLTVRTGGDDLRGGNDNAYATVVLADRRRFETPINRGARLADNSSLAVRLELPAGIPLGSVAEVSVRTTLHGDEIFHDNWNVDELVLRYVTTRGDGGTLERRLGTPYVRFTDQHQYETIYRRAADAPAPGTDAMLVRVTVRTGGDDLRAGNQANVTIGLRSGFETARTSLNEGGAFGGGSTFQRVVALPRGTVVEDLRWLRLDYDGRGAVDTLDWDNWNVDELLVEVLPDPVDSWIEQFEKAAGATLGRRLGLGTDFNGFAPQLPYTKRDMPTTVTVARDRAPAWAAPSTPVLTPYRLGARRTFDFRRDGIAHYGMLPELFEVVAAAPGGADVVSTLFRSAEDTIRAWERTLAARARVVHSEAP